MIPYTCELVALRTLRPAVFSVLMSLEPAAAALAGLVVVGEVLSPVQLVAMACVVAASVGATRSRRDHRRAGAGLSRRHISSDCSRSRHAGVTTYDREAR